MFRTKAKSAGINPATIYVVFSASGPCGIKARPAGNGEPLAKGRNAALP